MDGQDLIDLAGKLVANTAYGGAEARFRTAASRAYYGAYHIACQMLSEFDVRVKQNHNGHQEAYDLLFKTRVGQAQEAARLLNDLRADRNIADYDLHKPKFHKQENAQVCVESAHDAAKCFESCLNDPDIRKKLQEHFGATQG